MSLKAQSQHRSCTWYDSLERGLIYFFSIYFPLGLNSSSAATVYLLHLHAGFHTNGAPFSPHMEIL